MTTKTNIEAVALSDEQIHEIASSYMEATGDVYVSFLPSNLEKFARALLASKPAGPVQDETADGELIADLIEQNRTLRARLAAPAKESKPDAQGWQPIDTAPRDGSNILIRFGQDGVSQAKYVPGVPHPWKFIDTNDGITWLINGARDGECGPSHWQPMPSADLAAPASPSGEDAAEQAAVPQVGALSDPMDYDTYALQMAGITSAALGYWKEGDEIHPDYDTPALRDVAKLYAKYAMFRETLASLAACIGMIMPNCQWTAHKEARALLNGDEDSDSAEGDEQ